MTAGAIAAPARRVASHENRKERVDDLHRLTLPCVEVTRFSHAFAEIQTAGSDADMRCRHGIAYVRRS
jgi:hypothetical protein